MTGRDVLLENEENDMVEKASIMKIFEHYLIDKELKAQTDIAKKQYQVLDKSFISKRDNKNVNESLIKKEKEKHDKSNLIYNKLQL